MMLINLKLAALNLIKEYQGITMITIMDFIYLLFLFSFSFIKDDFCIYTINTKYIIKSCNKFVIKIPK